MVADNAAMRPRLRLGRELRDRRLLAGLSGTKLGEIIGITQSKVSRTEHARFRPDMPAIRRWLAATDTPARDFDRILTLAEAATTEVPEYRTISRGSLLSAGRDLMAQDVMTTAIRHFSLLQIPEPFQTQRYAQLALSAIDDLDELDDLDDPDDPAELDSAVRTAVEARLARGRRLIETGSPTYHVVLTESALRHRPQGATEDDEAAARERLLECAAAESVTVQVIPLGTPLRYAPLCAFVGYEFHDSDEDPVVSVHLPPLEMTFSGTDDLLKFEQVWDHLVKAALDPAASKSFIRSIP